MSQDAQDRQDGSHESPAPPPPPAVPAAASQAPGAGGYAEPGTYGAPSATPRNGLGTAALVLGIVGVVFAVIFFPIGLLLAVAGIAVGIAGMRRASRGEATNRGMALTGTVLSVLALLIAVAFGAFVGYILNETADCTDRSLSQSERQQCIQDRLEG